MRVESVAALKGSVLGWRMGHPVWQLSWVLECRQPRRHLFVSRARSAADDGTAEPCVPDADRALGARWHLKASQLASRSPECDGGHVPFSWGKPAAQRAVAVAVKAPRLVIPTLQVVGGLSDA